MKSIYSTDRYIKIVFFVLVTIICFGFIFAQHFCPSEREPETMQDALVYEGALFWEKPNGSKEQITAPGTYPLTPGQVMVITTTLPENFEQNAICIRGSQQSVRFYIDNELRSEYDTTASRPFGSDSTSRYVFCKTSAADAGKELRIELKSNTKRYSGVVNEIFCGDKLDIWAYIFRLFGIESLNAIFILFCGIITILFSIALGIAYKTKINLVYLGWCMVLGSIWLIGESKLRQLYVSNASVLSALCFIVVMLCPIPILLYVDSVQKGQYRKFYCVLEWIAVANLVICSILQFTETADYLDTMFLSHIIMGGTCLAVFVTFFLDWRKGRIQNYLLILIGLLAAMLAAIIEIVSVYFVVYSSGIILGTGLLLLLFFTIINTIKDIHALEQQRHLEENLKRRKQTEAMSLQMIQTLSTTIEAKDEYTKGHSYRVAEYSAMIAKELGWSDIEAENLKNAAYLHDIGKIGIPDTILNKPSTLLEAEYDIIKKHTTIGADILRNVTLVEHMEEIARYHHERYDGNGYPEGLCGKDIPIHARIVAVADSYDAMSSKRIYRNPLSKTDIRKEFLRNRGTQFDPDITDAFLRLLDKDCLQIRETAPNTIAGGMLSEFEMDKTLETGRLISDLMDTMKNQRESVNIDYLTGLPTRNIGEKQIAESMQEHAGCLIFLDMDNLKKINDIYGHKAGDKVLKLLGSTITDYMHNSIACRLGGDEFLVFLPDISKETVSEQIEHIFNRFQEKKNADAEIRCATLSGGLYMSQKGDSFSECYAKADKALYSVKQTGKNDYAFYHQLEQYIPGHQNTGKDLELVAKTLSASGSYTGALDLDNREFAKIYEYMGNLGERYMHTCHLVMITLDAVTDATTFIEKIEQALDCMESAIRENIRNVDICTRYSSMQYLVILMEAGEKHIPLVMERIFTQYYKLYNQNDFQPRYEFMPMMQSDKESS